MRTRLALVATFALPVALLAAAFDAASATNQLGLDLYRQLSKENSDTNLVLSPYSITTALALAYTGSDGTTRTEMARALHFPADDLQLQDSLNSLCADLDKVTADSVTFAKDAKEEGGSSDPIEWHLANRLYGQTGYAFRDAFLTRMKDGYGAALEPVNFRQDAPTARLVINRWVEDQTREKIRDLIPDSGVTADTRLVLVNALYLKAPWAHPFEPALTQPAPFYVGGTRAHSVPTMAIQRHFRYRHAEGVTTIIVPYVGTELQFVIFLPDKHKGLESLEARLTADFLRASGKPNNDPASHAYVRLFLPKLRLAGPSLGLSNVLQTLGMKSAFDRPPGSADFGRIAERHPDSYLSISAVIHKTFLELDEKGTEAAAATAIVMMTGSVAPPPKPIEVRVDRPFLFAIQHRKTGLCLFFGRVADPM